MITQDYERDDGVRRRKRTPSHRKLRFSPAAWAKLVYQRDLGPTEIGGFGISAQDDPLFVTDFILVRQTCTAVTVAFDDDAVADFFDEQVSAGRQPRDFARIWIHTHPGTCPQPSGTDELTFRRCFGAADWAVMFIIARGGATYGRLRCGISPGISRRLTAEVDYSGPFSGSSHDKWDAEYHTLVTCLDPFAYEKRSFGRSSRQQAAASPLTGADARSWHERRRRRMGEDNTFDHLFASDPRGESP